MNDSAESVILLLGPTGQIGHHLQKDLREVGAVIPRDRSSVDLREPNAIRETVHDVNPDVVVNAAAYTAVDEAETDQAEAQMVNGEAPGVLAEVTDEIGGWFVHYSTDYVFDGSQTTPYVETDRPNPVNTYGRTKLAGERAIQEVGGQYLILRTGWVYSARRDNFLRTMLRLAGEHDTLTVVDDQIGTPTWAGWIAEATATILQRLQSHTTSDEVSGLYHLAASGQTSWYGFAQAIFAQFGRDVEVQPVSSDEYPTAADRPAYTVLDSSKARKTFDLPMSTWTEQLDALRGRIADG